MCFFACGKSLKKHAKKLRNGRLGGMRGVCGEVRRGAYLCKSLHAEENHAKSFAKEFMQSYDIHLARRAGVRRMTESAQQRD